MGNTTEIDKIEISLERRFGVCHQQGSRNHSAYYISRVKVSWCWIHLERATHPAKIKRENLRAVDVLVAVYSNQTIGLLVSGKAYDINEGGQGLRRKATYSEAFRLITIN